MSVTYLQIRTEVCFWCKKLLLMLVSSLAVHCVLWYSKIIWKTELEVLFVGTRRYKFSNLSDTLHSVTDRETD